MSKRKLLLADDSVTIQKVVSLTFADEDIEIISVNDGDAAMHKFVEVMPDLVMLDVNLSGLDGYRICEIIKHDTETKHIPVILLVGSFEPFDEAKAKQAGADDFLTKPFQSIRQLVNKVSNLLEPKTSEEKNLLPTENVNLSEEFFDETFDNESSEENNSAESSIENLGESELSDKIVQVSPNNDLTEDTDNEFESTSVNEAASVYESFAEDLDNVYDEIPNDSVETIIESEAENLEIDEEKDEIIPAAEERQQKRIMNFDDFDLLEFPQAKTKSTSNSRELRYTFDLFEQENRSNNQGTGDFSKHSNVIKTLSPELIEAIADKVAEKLSNKVVRRIVREVIAQLDKSK